MCVRVCVCVSVSPVRIGVRYLCEAVDGGGLWAALRLPRFSTPAAQDGKVMYVIPKRTPFTHGQHILW